MNNANIIKISSSYRPGEYSKQYRINKKYINNNIFYYLLKDICLIKNIRRKKNQNLHNVAPFFETPKSQRLNILKSSITIETDKALDWVNSQTKYSPLDKANMKYNIECIANKDFYIIEDNFSGREHSNLTNLPKYVRHNFVRINGKPIKQCDIKSSQPTFLYNILNKEYNIKDVGVVEGEINLHNVAGFSETAKEIKRYGDLLKRGCFYEHIQSSCLKKYGYSITRNEAKLIVFKVFYDKERDEPIKKQKTNWHYQQLFKNEFPYIYNIIQAYHSAGKNKLCKILQTAEKQYVFNKSKQLIHRGTAHFLVHDAIYFAEDKYEDIFNDVIK
jgi:hypothetical protein